MSVGMFWVFGITRGGIINNALTVPGGRDRVIRSSPSSLVLNDEFKADLEYLRPISISN